MLKPIGVSVLPAGTGQPWLNSRLWFDDGTRGKSPLDASFHHKLYGIPLVDDDTGLTIED